MDADIRAALRAMALPGALEAIPDQAFKAILDEAMRRGMLKDVVAALAIPGPYGADPGDPRWLVLDQWSVQELEDLAMTLQRRATMRRNDERLQEQERLFREGLERRAAERARAQAELEAACVGTVRIPGASPGSWATLIGTQLAQVTATSFLVVPLKGTRGLSSLRAYVKRARPGLKVSPREGDPDTAVIWMPAQ